MIPEVDNEFEIVVNPKIYLFHNSFEVGLFGLMIAIGGQLYGWNTALNAGFGSWITAQTLMGLAYICLVLCLSEIVSGIAFDGGLFGIARVMIGVFPGFLISFMIYSEYIMMTSAAVSFIGLAFVELIGCDDRYQPLIWMVFLAIAFLACFRKTSVQAMCYLCGGGSLLLVLVYGFGCMQYTSLKRYGPLTVSDDNSAQGQGVWFSNAGLSFISTFTLATWPFAGIEAVTLLTSFTENPKVHISRGLLVGMGALFFSSMLISFVACSLPPGLSSTQGLTYFMSAGLDLAFGASETLSLALILPGQFAMAWGFLLPFGSLLHAMAESKFVPTCSYEIRGHPHAIYLAAGCIICFLVCLVGWLAPAFNAVIQNIAILSGLVSYIVQLVAFVKLRTIFSTVERHFWSPLGIPGALFAGIMFSACFISTAFFQDDDYVAILSFTILLLLITIYYYCYAKHKQTMSHSEQTELFRLNVIAFNIRKANKARNSLSGRKSSSLMTGIFTLYHRRVSAVKESYKVNSLDDGRRSNGSVAGRQSAESVGGRRKSIDTCVARDEAIIHKDNHIENIEFSKGECKYGLKGIKSENEIIEKETADVLFVTRKLPLGKLPNIEEIYSDAALGIMAPIDVV